MPTPVLTKQQVIDWLRATAADYVEGGEFARHLNAAAAMLAGEPSARHELYNGETVWNFHQQCCCDRCRQVYSDIQKAQAQNDLGALNRT